jgi:hypothetical protein
LRKFTYFLVGFLLNSCLIVWFFYNLNLSLDVKSNNFSPDFKGVDWDLRNYKLSNTFLDIYSIGLIIFNLIFLMKSKLGITLKLTQLLATIIVPITFVIIIFLYSGWKT